MLMRAGKRVAETCRREYVTLRADSAETAFAEEAPPIAAEAETKASSHD